MVMGLVMLFNVTAFQIFADGEPDWVSDKPAGIVWDPVEQVWVTESNDGKFGNYSFEAFWDPVNHKVDYTWDATQKSEKDSKEVRIVFTFNNVIDTNIEWKAVSDGTSADNNSLYNSYPDIWFEIPGIADARRGEKQAAVIGKNNSDFSCDHYEVSAEEGDGGKAVYKLNSNIQTLNGGMEIVWDYNPRQMVDGYTKELNPAAYIKVYEHSNPNKYHVVKVLLPPMHFEFLSERDNIAVDINEELQNDFDGGEFDKHYTWKRISTEFKEYAKTRPLNSAVYTLEFLKEDIDKFIEATRDDDDENDNENENKNVYLKINNEYINFKEYVDNGGITTSDDDKYYILRLDEDKAFKSVVDFSQGADTHATNNREWKGVNASNIYIGIHQDSVESRVSEVRFSYANDKNLLNPNAKDAYAAWHKSGGAESSSLDLNDVPDSTIAAVKTEKSLSDGEWNALDEATKKKYVLDYVEKTIEDAFEGAVKERFEAENPGRFWNNDLEYVTKEEYLYNYKYGSLTEVEKSYKIPLNVQSHIVRKYEETDSDLDGNIPSDEQYIADAPDNYLDPAVYFFGRDPHTSEGSIGVEKHIKNESKSHEPVMNSDTFKSGRDITYVIGASAKKFDENYELVIGDDKLLVMTDNEYPTYDIESKKAGYNVEDGQGPFYTIKGQNYRELEDDEYYVKEIFMPKYSTSYNINGNADGKSYNYTIYDITNGVTPIGTGDTSDEKIITLQDQSVRKVEIVIQSDDSSSIAYSPEIKYNFKLRYDGSVNFRSGRGDDLTEDPYGRLVNFSYAYARKISTSESPSTKADAIAGAQRDSVDRSEYRYYHDRDGNILVYNIYSNQKYNSQDFSFVKADNDGADPAVDTDADEYLKEGLYKYRDAAGLRLRDPSVQITESVSYSKDKDGYMVELPEMKNGEIVYDKYGNVVGSGEYKTTITSKITITADTSSVLKNLKISTIIPKQFADNNINKKLSGSNITVENVKITEITEDVYADKVIKGSDLYPYLGSGTGTAAEMKPLKDSDGNDTDYYVYEEVIDFGDNYITIDPENPAEISFSYPLEISAASADQWKQTLSSNNIINGAALAKIQAKDINVIRQGSINSKISSDIYNNNVPDETAKSDASASTTIKLPVTASVWNEKAVKTVKSTVRGSDMGKTLFGHYAEVNPLMSEEKNSVKYAEYTYNLSFTMGNSYAKRVFIYDNIEEMDYAAGNSEGKTSKWKGTLKSVNVTGSSTNLGKMTTVTDGENNTIIEGMKGTVYYRTESFPTELYEKGENNIADDVTEPEGGGWVLAGEYHGDLSDVKAICVMVEMEKKVNGSPAPALIEKSKEMHFTVTMQAPDKDTANDEKYLEESTFNHILVRYSREDSTGNRNENYAAANPNNPVISDVTEVTLKDKMVNLKVVKTEFGKKVVSSKSTKEYMSLAGSTFQIYKIKGYTDDDPPNVATANNNEVREAVKNKSSNADPSDNTLFPTDDGGELSLNLESGWYILKEKSAPEGYKQINELLFRIKYEYSDIQNPFIDLPTNLGFTEEIPSGQNASDYTEVLDEDSGSVGYYLTAQANGKVYRKIGNRYYFGLVESIPNNGNASDYLEITDKNNKKWYYPKPDTLNAKVKIYDTVGGNYVPVDGAEQQVFFKWIEQDDSTGAEVDVVQLEVADKVIPGKVTLTKYDKTYNEVNQAIQAKSNERYAMLVPNVTYRFVRANGSLAGDRVYVVRDVDGTYKYTKDAFVSNATDKVTTNSQGKVIITDLPWGSYFLIEQNAPVGYEVPDESDRNSYVSFSVPTRDSDGNYNQEFDDSDPPKPIYMTANVDTEDNEEGYSVNLTKKDTDGNLISNAAFSLRVWNPERNEWVPAFDEYNGKISRNGRVEFKNIDDGFPILAKGMKYCIEEIHAASNYKLKGENKFSPVFDFDFEGPEQSEKNITTTVKKEGIEFKKEVYNQTDDILIAKYNLGTDFDADSSYTKNGDKYTKNETLKTVITNSGNIITKKVYTYTGTFDPNAEPDYTLTVNKAENTLKVDVTMVNDRKAPSLTIKKTDPDGRTALAGARFALYEVVGSRDSVTVSNGNETLTQTGNDPADIQIPIKNNVTGSNGELKIEFTDSSYSLDWNKDYYLVELAAPKGYKQPENYVYPFKLKDKVDNKDPDIKQEKPTSDSIPLIWTLENERKLGNVTLTKYKGIDAYGNKGDSPEKLAGATFRLLDGNNHIVQNNAEGDNAIKINGKQLKKGQLLDGNTMVCIEGNTEGNVEMKTDIDGVLKIENLPWGRNYRLEEIDSGNVTLDTVEIKKFTIDKNHLTIDKEAVDPIKSDTLVLQKEIDEWNLAFGDATFIFKVKELKADTNGSISIEGETGNYSYSGTEFTRMVTFNSDNIGDLMESVKFSNLTANSWYEVSEIPVARYQLESIDGVTVKGDGNTDKEATEVKNIDVNTRKCYVKIIHDGSNTVKFENHLKYYDKFTENATRNNNVEKDVMVSGVHFNINGNLLNHPETLSLRQENLAISLYNFLETLETPETIDGKRVYPSDAFEVYISVDDPNVGDIRVYPEDHELYDPTVGYYEILKTEDVFTDGGNEKTENNEYVSAGNGIINFPDNEQDVSIRIKVVLPTTSKYTWVNDADEKHQDNDVLHIETAPVPDPVKFTFSLDNWVEVNDENTTLRNWSDDEGQNLTGAITWVTNDSEDRTIEYKWDSNNGKYVLDTNADKTFADIINPTATNQTYNFSDWYIEDPEGTYKLLDGMNEDTFKNYVSDSMNAGKEYTIYPSFIQGRAMFSSALKTLVQNNKSTLVSVQRAANKTQFEGLGGSTIEGGINDVSNLTYDLGNERKTNIHVYAVYNDTDKTVYWYSADPHPFTPANVDFVVTSSGGQEYGIFSNCTELTNVSGIENWDTSKTTSMWGWFRESQKLKYVDLSKWDTSKVTTFRDMFSGDNELETVKMTFNTSGQNDRILWYMFGRCSNLSTVTLNGDFSGVVDANNMFLECRNLLNLRLNHVSMANGEDSRNYATKQEGNNKAFANCTNFSYMFKNCEAVKNIAGLENWDTSKGTDFRCMFSTCMNLGKREVEPGEINLNTPDFSGWDTHSSTTFSNMFENCYELEELNMTINTSGKSVPANHMFHMNNNNKSKLNSMTINGDFSGITTAVHMFYQCNALTDFNLNHVSMAENVNSTTYSTAQSGTNQAFQRCTNFGGMFLKCSALTYLDLSSFNIASCSGVDDGKSFCDTFSGCSNLVAIKINKSTFKTSNQVRFTSTFNGCTKLRYIGENVTPETANTVNSLFDFSGFSADITRTDHMFQGCQAVEVIDISSFTTANLTNIAEMFRIGDYNNNKLTTIYANPTQWDTKTTYDSQDYVFADCKKLVGGVKYSVINPNNNSSGWKGDRAKTTKGYFTAKIP